MPDPRTLAKLMADGAAMREQIDRLEARVARLEAELAPTRASPGPSPSPTKRSAAHGPPPLPRMSPSVPAVPKSVGRRSVVDVSEIAELVESRPPPPPSKVPRPRK